MKKLIAFFMVCAFAIIGPADDANALFRTAKVYNAVDVAFESNANTIMQSLERVITAAFEEELWTVEHIAPGHLEAWILVTGRHLAKVDVTYDLNKYSIMYKDSETLMYDGKKIHKNYNRWVQKVEHHVDYGIEQIYSGEQIAFLKKYKKKKKR
jgi:hypothetical protein